MAVFVLANANYSFGVSEVDTGPVPSVSGNQVFFRVDSARDDFDVFGTGFTYDRPLDFLGSLADNTAASLTGGAVTSLRYFDDGLPAVVVTGLDYPARDFYAPVTGVPGDIFRRLAGGNDTFYLASGNDLVVAGNGDDLVFAGPGNDNVVGGFGNDTLYGQEGNDAIGGGPGRDVLGGGIGADLFTYAFAQDSAGPGAGGAGYDVILDFQPGIDRIDLSLIDANPFLLGDQAFVFAAGGLTGQAGQVTLVGNSLFADTNGDRVPDLDVYLLNVFSLTAADFSL